MRLSDPKLWLALVSLAVVVAIVLRESESTSPGPLTAPHAAVSELAGAEGCERCHGDADTTLAQACASCHERIGKELAAHSGFHGTRKGVDVAQCGTCHVEHHGDAVKLVDARVFAAAGVADRASFEHDFVPFRLIGAHAGLECSKCHRHADAEPLPAGAQRFGGLEQRCTACHADPHDGSFAQSCDTCHGQQHPFKSLENFVHTAELPLVGAHSGITCAQCHPKGSERSVERVGGRGPKPPPRACQDCHASPHAPRFVAAVALQLGTSPAASCAGCHPATRKGFAVAASEFAPERHAATGFPLDAPHAKVRCEQCHAGYGAQAPFAARYPGRAATDCGACHADPHAGQFADAGGVQPGCIQCHAREGFTPHLFDTASHSRTAFPLDGAHVRAKCDQCHSKDGAAPRTFRGTPARCNQCHTDVHGGLFALVSGLRPELEAGSCGQCHTTERFERVEGFGAQLHERLTSFALAGAHQRAECRACHIPAPQPDAAGRRFGRVADVFGTPVTECSTCHADVHRGAFERGGLPRAVGARTTCARCHSEERFDELPRGFEHGEWTAFALAGAHARAECTACHGSGAPAPKAARPAQRVQARRLGFADERAPTLARDGCAACHEDVHQGHFDRPGLPTAIDGAASCARCHDVESFGSAARERFDHALWTGYALEGRHAQAACEACHVPEPAAPGRKPRRLGAVAGASCADCHADPHAAQFGARRCDDCHASARDFGELRFDHARDSRFALDANHAKLECSACHRPWPLSDGRTLVRYKPLGTTCVECHGFEKGRQR